MNRPEIDERFFNYPPEFCDAVERFHASGDPALIDPLLDGVVRKYVPEGALANGGADASLNAFGVESLTLIEIILDLQDAFAISLTDKDLLNLHTLDDVRALLTAKARARAPLPAP